MDLKNLEPIRVLFIESWDSTREVRWYMQVRGRELFVYNKRILVKRLNSDDAVRFFAGVEFPHGGGRRVRFLGRIESE